MAGCPPVGPASIKNFTTAGLLCGKPESSNDTKTTKAPAGVKTTKGPGGKSPLDEDGNVYHYSKLAVDKVEWRIDGSKLNGPISGSYEYIK